MDLFSTLLPPGPIIDPLQIGTQISKYLIFFPLKTFTYWRLGVLPVSASVPSAHFTHPLDAIPPIHTDGNVINAKLCKGKC